MHLGLNKMRNKLSTFILILLPLFLGVSLKANAKFLSIEVEKPIYTADINDLFFQSISKSYKINAQIYEILSNQHLTDAARYYYIPSATITGAINWKFDRPSHPDPYPRFLLDLTATMKLWSNATSDKLDGAYYSLIASKEKYNEITNDIYFTINNNLMKIEFAREFLAKAKQYRVRMDALLERMNVASQFGIMKKSDRLFADVSLKKFDESILNVNAQIEQYISLINNITPDNLYNEKYGLSQNYLKNALTVKPDMFDIKVVTQRNFGILSRTAQLKSDKFNTQGYNENFIVELATEHGIEEHSYTSTKNEDNEALYGYSYDDDGSAYIGINFTYTGMNYQSYKQKRSEYNLYTKKAIELDEFVHQVYVDLNTYKQQYDLILKRIQSIENQIKLTTDVINSLMEEMIVDESNTLDIFRNVSSLSDLEMNRLNVLNELIDIVKNVKSINSVIPKKYVIN